MKCKIPDNLHLVWKSEKDLDPGFLSRAEVQVSDLITSPIRKTQFVLGRQAIKEALQSAGLRGSIEILRGERGEPIIPSGFSGSITHSNDYSKSKKNLSSAVAVAADKTHYSLLGVDIEHISREIKPDTYRAIATKPEIEWIKERDSSLRALMLVAAKEALYKMLYPGTGVYFGMHDAVLTWDESNCEFSGKLNKKLNDAHSLSSNYKISVGIQDDYILAICAYKLFMNSGFNC